MMISVKNSFICGCFLITLAVIACAEQSQKYSENKVEKSDVINVFDTIQLASSTKPEIKSSNKDEENKVKPPLGIQDKKCNINILVEISQNIGNPSKTLIEEFLSTFDPTCQSNVEYTEFSNELLFKVLDTATKETIEILSKNKTLDKTTIFSNLESPIDDSIDVAHLIEKIDNVKGYDSIRIELNEHLRLQ